MKNRIGLIAFCSGLAMLAPAVADAAGWAGFGVRAGIELDNSDHDLRSYELFAAYALPWEWRWDSGWTLGTRLNASVGLLDGDGDSGAFLTVGPGLELGRGNFFVNAGVNFALLEDAEFDDFDLGGQVQFLSQLTLGYRFTEQLSLGYRIQHISNAGLDESNPGLDLQVIELGYRF
jgi:hypothetical protein